MLFKDLKAGYPIYIFDRNEIVLTTAKVSMVSVPHIDPKYNSPIEMVVDVTVEDNNKNQTYTFKDGSEVGYVSNFMITPNKEAAIREIEAIKIQSEDALSKINEHEIKVQKCTELLSEVNPIYKEKKETDERFSKLEKSIEAIKNAVMNLTIKDTSVNNLVQ